MAIVVIISWYTIGFLTAAHLIRRGHDRTVWIMAAALTGALVLVAALVLAAWRAVQPRSSLVASTPPEVVVVVTGDPAPAFSSLSRFDPMPASVTLLALASHESTSTWVDTGESEELDLRFAAHRMLIPLPTTEAVVTGGPTALAEVGARVIVLPRVRTEHSRRHDAWRVLTAARSSGTAVLSPAVTGPRHTAGRGLTAPTKKAMA